MARSIWKALKRRLTTGTTHPDRAAGDAARDRRDWNSAADLYQRYLRQHPGHAAVWLRLGNMLKELDRRDEADAAYARGAALDPSNGTGPRLRGHLAASDGRLKDAARHFVEAWTRDRDSAAGMALTRPDQRINLARLQDGQAWRIVGAVDGLRNLTLEGWVWSPEDPETPVWVDVRMGGQTIGKARADRYRFDISDAGLAPAQCGFAFELGPFLANGSSDALEVVVAGTGMPLAGSPFPLSETRGLQKWLQRERPAPGRAEPPVVTIITPVHDVRADWFGEAVAGVLAQGDGRWEWVIVDDGSKSPDLIAQLARLPSCDGRIRVITLPVARGTAGATNVGLADAKTEHVLFLDHDDQLEPEAIGRVADAAAAGADLIYGDEVLTGTDIRELRMLVARPAFSWRYYLSHPYFVHPVAVRRSWALDIGGMDEALPASADVDFMLRVFERAPVVAHLPGVLYRWRTHSTSAGHARSQAVHAATSAAISRHLGRLGLNAKIGRGPIFNTFRIDFPDPGGRVLVIIPTRDRVDLLRTCLESVRCTTSPRDIDILVIDHESKDPETLAYMASLEGQIRIMPYSGPFNYSQMNNRAMAEFGEAHPFVLFLNNDIEAMADGWLSRMRSLAAMADVGAVGATLLYPDNRVQHAGVVIGGGGYAEHAMKFEPPERDGHRNAGYNCGLTSIRDWSAVTGACLMMRSQVFREVGGFDESLPVGFNDTDLCLRIRERGLNVLNDGRTVLRHNESATRSSGGDLSHPEDSDRFAERWAALLEAGDPFYNPMLSLQHDHRPDHPDTPRTSARIGRARLPTSVLAGPDA